MFNPNTKMTMFKSVWIHPIDLMALKELETTKLNNTRFSLLRQPLEKRYSEFPNDCMTIGALYYYLLLRSHPMSESTPREEFTKTVMGQLVAEIMRFHGESKEDASRLATILLPHIDTYASAEVLAVLDRLERAGIYAALQRGNGFEELSSAYERAITQEKQRYGGKEQE